MVPLTKRPEAPGRSGLVMLKGFIPMLEITEVIYIL